MTWFRPGRKTARDSPIRIDNTGADRVAAASGRPWRAFLLLAILIACSATLFCLKRREQQHARIVVPPTDSTAIADTVPPDLIPAHANTPLRQPPSPFRFTEITGDSGVDFVHVSGMTQDKHFPTAYGSGVAIFDYDGDGKLDLYFATATRLPVGSASTGPNRLYRNLGQNRFVDATIASGLGFAGYCQGVTIGDVDNDGDPDVFLCNYGPDVLYLNNGSGTFKDISVSAGIANPGWSSAAAFLDYDNDGRLDLYVARYGQWKLPENDDFCGGTKVPGAPGPERIRIYCSPKSIRPGRHTLYRNNGDRTFTDVTAAAGVARTDGRGLGVVAADLNDDGRIDLYVANDMCPNFVFFNQGDGTFRDATLSSGAGFGPEGQTRAGMGVDAEDVDGDGRVEILVTNFSSEGLGLFTSLGDGFFEDRARKNGLIDDSLPWVGWGCALADFDRDGWADCFVSNGHVDDNLGRLGNHFSRYAEPALLYQNRHGAGFALATRDAGSYFARDHVGRGVAYGDFDNDGDVDLVVNHKDGPPAILRNDTPTSNHWVRITLAGTRSNRDGVGARVEFEADGQTIVRQRKGGASYGSAHDPRLLIGLRQAGRSNRVTVRWPSGRVDRYRNLPSETDVLLREGAVKPEVDGHGP
jgi:enediyne biosynthesis protein E4